MSRILVTGGCGYIGSVLVPQLLKSGHEVIVYDIMYFGNYLLQHPNLLVIKGDIRETRNIPFRNVDVIIHLACISNDPCFELDPELSTSINLTCFEPLVIAAKKAGVKRFIYASSSAAYGVSTEKDVTEEHPMNPITLYGKYKYECEPILFKHQSDDFTCVVVRPVTICGVSPRMRFDVVVNLLTNLAITTNKITVFGTGKQMRGNIHIQDMCDCYEMLLTAPKEKIAGEVFNIGHVNHTVEDLAYMVERVIHQFINTQQKIKIVYVPDNDPRSYHLNSDKITRILDFKTKYSIEKAIWNICEAFNQRKFPNSLTDERYYNIKTMKKLHEAQNQVS